MTTAPPGVPRPLLMLVAVLIAAMVGGVGLFLITRPDPREVCDGVTRRAGGCDPGQPVFTEIACAGVGREFGIQLDRRLTAILDEPQVKDGENRGVRAGRQTYLLTTRANQYLRRQGMVTDCDVDEFLTAATTQFGPRFKEGAGSILSDTGTVSYEEYLDALRDILKVIDQAEHLPA